MPVPSKCALGDGTPERFSRASVGVLGTGGFPGSGRWVHVAGGSGGGWALCLLSTPWRVTTSRPQRADLVPAESRPGTQADAHSLEFVLFLSKTLTWLVFHLWKRNLTGALEK